MFCRECGKKVEEGNKFCTGCGSKIEPIKVERISKEKVDTNETRENINLNKSSNNNIEDKVSIGLNILSLFLPIVGLVLFLTYRKETPKKAKAIGICTLIGYIITIISTIVCCVLLNLWVTKHTYRNKYDNYKYEYEYRYNI